MTATLLFLPLTACLTGGEIVFPPGLEPIEENTAPWPQPEPGNPYPETLSLVSGETDTYAWTHARGYVHGSVQETWDALQEPEVVVDRRGVDAWDVTLEAEEGYDVAFTLHNEVYDIITIEFDMAWRQGAVAGSIDSPQAVGVRFMKVAGTSLIDIMEGSITVYEVEDHSAIELIEHLEAYSTGTEETEAWMTDIFASVVAWVAGDPLPTYN